MVNYSVKGNVAVIVIDNPPLNALSIAVRRKVVEGLQAADKDPQIAKIVITGAGKNFCAGADISEFHTIDVKKKPTNLDVVEAVENCRTPVIAAINGYALGGGLEIAMACHYRIATMSSKLGLPEVAIGILPGAGGTQRLPRLIGLNNAMKWIVYGGENSAHTAMGLGLLDRIYPSDSNIVMCARQYAHSIGSSLHNRIVSKLPVKDAAYADEIFNKHKAALSKKSRGALSPLVALHTTKYAAILPYEKGIKKEEEGLAFLSSTSQLKAMVYAFFVERLAKKWILQDPRLDSTNAVPADVKSAAVIGLGTMGRGIAISLLRAGISEVRVLEMNKKALDIGVNYIESVLANDFKKGFTTQLQIVQMTSSLVPVTDYTELHNVDLVIEAVFEGMQLKQEIFKKLDSICKPSAILASNTSALNIDEIASATKRPHQVIGMHFFAPAHVMKLLENVRGAKTSLQTIATAMKLGEKMKKVTVLVGNCHGFVGNRMFFFYTSGSDFLLEEGAYPEQVDEALRKFGFAMGRYQVGDLSGNDIGYKIRSKFGFTNKQQPPGASETERFGKRYCTLSDLLVESGRLGYKSGGKGWFTYVGKPKELTVDPIVTKMIDDYRKRNNIVPRRIEDEEILERMLYPLINEGFNVLDDGIAANPSLIDLVMMHGYAWPRHTGGPMFYAHTVGWGLVASGQQTADDVILHCPFRCTPFEIRRLTTKTPPPSCSTYVQTLNPGSHARAIRTNPRPLAQLCELAETTATGLPRILEALERRWKESGAREPQWEPSKMLVKLVREHGNPPITDWMRFGKSSTQSSL